MPLYVETKDAIFVVADINVNIASISWQFNFTYCALRKSMICEYSEMIGVPYILFSLVFHVITAKELQRVAALNVLGKSMKNFKAPSTFQDRLEK